MRFAQIGNFGSPHSTENELRKAIPAAGHEVVAFQEDADGTFEQVAARVAEFDVVLWTKIDRPGDDLDARQRMLDAAQSAGVPTVGYHLDLWHGLHRAPQLADHPFFRQTLVVTADGGHEEEFAAAGINHAWLPPGVSAFEAAPGTPQARFEADIAFVGSWRGYHPEHAHRQQLCDWLAGNYEGRVQFWPRVGEPAVRCEHLRDLYATTKVNVGDSCFAGKIARYWSDRIPETLGRGGFLLHPYVDGIEDHFTDGEHLRLWPAGDWDQLRILINYYLAHEDERRRIASQGRAHVLEHHTYTVRIGQLIDLLAQRGLIQVEAMA